MLRFLGLLLLLVATHAVASVDGRQKEQELSELRSRLEQLRQELEQAAEDRAEAADALRQSEQRISEVKRDLRKLGQQERTLNQDLTRLAEASAAVETELAQHQQRLAELVRQRYYQGGEDSSKLLLGGSDPSAIARNFAYYAYIGRARADLIQGYRAALARLAQLRVEVSQRRASLDQVKQESLAHKQTLEAEKAERSQVLARISDQIHAQRKEITSLERDEKRLANLIEKLRRLAAAQARKAAAKKNAKSAKPGQKVEQVASAALAGIDFPKLKGKLALPVAGEIAARFGQAREGGGPTWKGVFIRSGAGRDVRAVASGEVVFADWLRGFGNLLIIDHGDGYLSLYSNNESLYKQPGDAVRAGDTVASVGSTGGQSEPGLYFELRHQGKPFDPMSWVASR